MNLIQAQAKYAELNAKIKAGGNLSNEEQLELSQATAVINAAADTPMVGKPTLEDARAFLRQQGAISKSIFSNPTVILAGKVLGILAVAGVSAFGGMKYGERRTSRRFASGEFTHGPETQARLGHSDSPQSHPATSPLDGRHFNHQGNPGNEGNTTNHPGTNAGGRQRATANT